MRNKCLLFKPAAYGTFVMEGLRQCHTTEVFSVTESDFCLEVITLAAEWKAEAELPERPSRRTVSWTCKRAMKIVLESTRTPFTWCSGKSIDSALRDG